MLRAYPRDFRLAFGSDMTQVFCDCYRDTQSRGVVMVAEFWLRTILDVVRTAPSERWETFRKVETMKNLKREALGLVACLAILVVAFLLHAYIRTHPGTPISILGYALDAIVTAGVISNLVIFILMMATTRFSTFRTALWSLLIVNGLLLLVAMLIGSRVDEHFYPAPVILSYVVSFVFWVSIHWLWSQMRSSTQPA